MAPPCFNRHLAYHLNPVEGRIYSGDCDGPPFYRCAAEGTENPPWEFVLDGPYCQHVYDHQEGGLDTEPVWYLRWFNPDSPNQIVLSYLPAGIVDPDKPAWFLYVESEIYGEVWRYYNVLLWGDEVTEWEREDVITFPVEGWTDFEENPSGAYPPYNDWVLAPFWCAANWTGGVDWPWN